MTTTEFLADLAAEAVHGLRADAIKYRLIAQMAARFGHQPLAELYLKMGQSADATAEAADKLPVPTKAEA